MFRLFNLSKSFADFILMEQFQLDDWCHGLFIKCVIKGDDWDLHVYLCVSSVIQVPASKANVRWPDGGRRSEVKGHLRLLVWVPRHWCRLWNTLRPLPAYTCKNLLHILYALYICLFLCLPVWKVPEFPVSLSRQKKGLMISWGVINRISLVKCFSC